MVTGSHDCTSLVWDLTEFFKTNKREKLKPERILVGHDHHLTSIALNLDLDLIVTASKDCTCILYSFLKGHYLRSLEHNAPVSLVAISKYGKIVSYCLHEEAIYVHSINGELLHKEEKVGKIYNLVIDKSGDFVITAGGK
jgi:WD40 repeat protein